MIAVKGLVDIAALVSEVAEANKPLAVNKQQAISVTAPVNIVTMCDTDRIREAIARLLGISRNTVRAAVAELGSQLPKGMRRSLYLKDDDYRLSHLYGNFTTLTRFTEADLERVTAARKAAGPDFVLMVDANRGWSTEEAIRFARLAEPLDLRWFEEPCHWHDDAAITTSEPQNR